MEPYESKILEMIEKNKKIVVITAENRVSLRNIPEKLNQNFIDVGISEQNLIGIGAGLAKLGFLPSQKDWTLATNNNNNIGNK